MGSICSIFIPSSYEQKFTKDDWIRSDEGDYYIKILAKDHGMGKTPKVTHFMKNKDGNYEEVGSAIEHSLNGDVFVDISGYLHDGKIIIS